MKSLDRREQLPFQYTTILIRRVGWFVGNNQSGTIVLGEGIVFYTGSKSPTKIPKDWAEERVDNFITQQPDIDVMFAIGEADTSLYMADPVSRIALTLHALPHQFTQNQKSGFEYQIAMGNSESEVAEIIRRNIAAAARIEAIMQRKYRILPTR